MLLCHQDKEDRFRRIIVDLGGKEAAAKACKLKADASMVEVLKALDHSLMNKAKNVLQQGECSCGFSVIPRHLSFPDILDFGVFSC